MKKYLLFIALSVFLLNACKKESKPTTTTTTQAKHSYKVTYTIGCTDCSVNYYSDSLQNQQNQQHVNSSWTYSFYGKKGEQVILEAYNTSNVAQGVTATITLNDTVLVTQTNYCQIFTDAFVVGNIP